MNKVLCNEISRYLSYDFDLDTFCYDMLKDPVTFIFSFLYKKAFAKRLLTFDRVMG